MEEAVDERSRIKKTITRIKEQRQKYERDRLKAQAILDEPVEEGLKEKFEVLKKEKVRPSDYVRCRSVRTDASEILPGEDAPMRGQDIRKEGRTRCPNAAHRACQQRFAKPPKRVGQRNAPKLSDLTDCRSKDRLSSVEKQREQDARKWDPSLNFALSWLEQNESRFEEPILRPACMSVNVKDKRFVKQLENCTNAAQRKVNAASVYLPPRHSKLIL